MLKPSIALANALANAGGLKELLNGGKLYLFAGPVPATADAALNMVDDHTLIGVFTESDDGTTGLTFENPTGGILSKTITEVWASTTAFDGADDGETSLAPSFWRFCAGSDNGQGAADGSTGYRLQGTAGGPTAGAHLTIATPTLGDGVYQPLGNFNVRVGPAP